MTVFYALDVSGLADETEYNIAYAQLSAQRKAKADALKQKEDRCRSVGAGLLLNRVSDYPFVNVSHSGKYAICIASDHPVGCDVEWVNPEVNLKIADRFFAEAEAEDIKAAPNGEQIDRFFRYWTLKESFVKCLGLGFQIMPNTFSVALGDAITIRQDVTDKAYYLKEYSDLPGYKCSVCMEGEPCNVNLILLEQEWRKDKDE